MSTKLKPTVRNSSAAYASRLTFMITKMNIMKEIIITIPLSSLTTRPQHGQHLTENSRRWIIYLYFSSVYCFSELHEATKLLQPHTGRKNCITRLKTAQ